MPRGRNTTGDRSGAMRENRIACACRSTGVCRRRARDTPLRGSRRAKGSINIEGAETSVTLDGALTQLAYLGRGDNFRFGLRVLACALLASYSRKCLAQVGFHAVGVTKRTVEDRFHANLQSSQAPQPPAAHKR
jgi:hypothetical protein